MIDCQQNTNQYTLSSTRASFICTAKSNEWFDHLCFGCCDLHRACSQCGRPDSSPEGCDILLASLLWSNNSTCDHTKTQLACFSHACIRTRTSISVTVSAMQFLFFRSCRLRAPLRLLLLLLSPLLLRFSRTTSQTHARMST